MIGLLLAALASPALEETSAYLGAWASGDELLLIEPTRVGRFVDDKLKFYRSELLDDELLVQSGAVESYWSIALEGEALSLDDGAREVHFERSATVPDVFRVLSYPVPAHVTVPATRVSEIQAELAQRVEVDQAVRRRVDAEGFTDDLRDEMIAIDADNTKHVLLLLDEVGWIDIERFGLDAFEDAFLIVQHSADKRLQRTALPFIESGVFQSKRSGQSYALLFDRLRLFLGFEQRYGSQLGSTETGEVVLLPLENPERVNERREALGMQSLEAYFEMIPIPKPVRTLAEALLEPRPTPESR